MSVLVWHQIAAFSEPLIILDTKQAWDLLIIMLSRKALFLIWMNE